MSFFTLTFKINVGSGVVMHAFNSSTRKAKTEGSQ